MISNLPLSSIKKYLTGILPVGWEHFETESIILELNVPPSELLFEKINVIKALMIKPELFYEDVLFFLHACEVFNGQVTDFNTVPSITSLEAALAIVDMATFDGVNVEQSRPFGKGVRLAVTEILKDDGYSHTVWPFDVVGVTGLTAGAETSDMAKKEQAIKDYISGTYNQSAR